MTLQVEAENPYILPSAMFSRILNPVLAEASRLTRRGI